MLHKDAFTVEASVKERSWLVAVVVAVTAPSVPNLQRVASVVPAVRHW